GGGNLAEHNLEKLQQNQPHLVVDTSLYPPSYQQKLLTLLSEKWDLDANTDGVLIHSDNFQALNLLQACYREQVKCIYIDPPYNTEDDRAKGKFIYKDGYPTSTWLAMMESRLEKCIPLLNYEGFFACHIDENEHFTLEGLIKIFFGENDLGKLVWDKKNPKGDAKELSVQHEYVHLAVKEKSFLNNENAFSRDKENAEKILNQAEKLVKKYGISEKARKEFSEWMKKQKDFSGGERAYKFIDDNGDVYRPVSMAWPNKSEAPEEYFIPLIHPVTRKLCPVPARGWRNPPDTMAELLEKGLILFGKDETTQPNRKYLLKENLTENVPSIYSMGGSDDDLLKNLGINFPNPKPIKASQYFLKAIARASNSLVMDYFAGSGTTAHAVINLNREDGGNRKYILVEQGEYFDTVLKPRVQKVIYSENWKDGKPMPSEKASDGFNGVSQIVKVLKLESYEDTLNNLELKGQADFIGGLPESVQEDYLLRYLLDVESKGSLLNSDDFTHPFDYCLNIATDSAGAYTKTNIDLVETFNYLLGLRVQHITDEREKRGYVMVEGALPNGDRSLIVWRDVEKMGYAEVAQCFNAQNINPNSDQYDVVYLNGDHDMASLWQNEDGTESRLSLRAIEPEFLRLMFAQKGE
ncbi:methylation subunit, type III restriction-modification system, partial [Gallibacterium anatis str. Avicor]|uniref:site-specific DNA-methyltransferase n=1 Tax=Gallibacterium anatis TaxID=750 RepID=UPI00053205AC